MNRSAVAQALELEQRSLVELCAGLRTADWDRASLCKGWSVRDVLIHTVKGERELFHPNLARALAGDAAPLPGFDLPGVNRSQIEAGRRQTNEEILAEAEAAIGETREMLGGITDADFERPSWNPITPGTLGFYVKGRIWEWWTHGQDIRVPLRRLEETREPERTRPVVEVIRDGITGVFIPEKSKGVHVSYAFQVGDAGFTVRIDDGTCRVEDTFDPKATTRVKADPATFCLVGTRRVSQLKAVLQGKFKPSGNPIAGMKFLSYFRAP